MKNIFYYILFSIGLLYAFNTNGQVINKNDLERKIDTFIPTHINDTTPGLVIGVVQKGELIFSKGYGLANLSYAFPNDSKLVYNIGSVSKQFFVYSNAMLQSLNEENRLTYIIGKILEFNNTEGAKILLLCNFWIPRNIRCSQYFP